MTALVDPTKTPLEILTHSLQKFKDEGLNEAEAVQAMVLRMADAQATVDFATVLATFSKQPGAYKFIKYLHAELNKPHLQVYAPVHSFKNFTNAVAQLSRPNVFVRTFQAYAHRFSSVTDQSKHNLRANIAS